MRGGEGGGAWWWWWRGWWWSTRARARRRAGVHTLYPPPFSSPRAVMLKLRIAYTVASTGAAVVETVDVKSFPPNL